jgi:cell division protein FtsZ
VIKKFTSIDEVNNITSTDTFKPQIAVIGVGGAGTNAVNNMINMGLTGVKFIVVNTDSKSLEKSVSPYKLQIGPKVTKGLGAGSKPEIGTQAAEESMNDIKEVLEGINLVFITAGMGGGTGTGASQVVAKLAKDLDILTISFVTKPFGFEGNQRMDIAALGIAELEKFSDALVVISNQNIFSVVNDKTSVADAFRVTDMVLYSSVKAITDLLVSNGLVNLDFNDIKYVIEGKGRAMIGFAQATGEQRAAEVAQKAILNPLLEDVSIVGAKSVLINITGSLDMTLFEVDTIISTIKQELDKDAFINFGTIHDETLVDTIKVSIIATSLADNTRALLHKKQMKVEGFKEYVKSDIYPTKKLQELTEKTMQFKAPQQQVEQEDDEETEEQIEQAKEQILAPKKSPIKSIKPKKEVIEEQEENENYNHFEEENEEEDFEEEAPKPVAKKPAPKKEDHKKEAVSLFDIIRNKDNINENTSKIKDEDIINIKNRNKIAKDFEEEEKEESFFDLPSFLKKSR